MVETIRSEQLSGPAVRQDQPAGKDQLPVPLLFPHHLRGIFTGNLFTFHHDSSTGNNLDPDGLANMQVRRRRVKSPSEIREPYPMEENQPGFCREIRVLGKIRTLAFGLHPGLGPRPGPGLKGVKNIGIAYKQFFCKSRHRKR